MRDTPSMNNVYDSDYWRSVRQDELARGTRTFNASMTPLESGYVPKPAYASMFASPDTQQTNLEKKPSFVQSLTGEQVPIEHFTHNNMQPYFRGTVTQNMNDGVNSVLMENFTGRGELAIQKKEAKCFFQPTADLTNVCGMKNNNEFYLSQIQEPRARRNDFPIEKTMVGPGLNKGFTATPSGGFQQADTRQFMDYKSVDELRPLSRPKMTLPSRPQGPMKAPNTERGKIGEFVKNRPDTFYEQSSDQWLRTTGAVIKQTERPIEYVKPTARVDSHVPYVGNAKTAAQPGTGTSDDYGKSAIQVYDTARSLTATSTVVSNITSVVKAIIAPFVDMVRHTPKEYTIDSSRTFGNMSAQIPAKQTVYDPINHTMRTTTKETTIHDAQVGNARAQIPEKATLYDPINHIMRTTIKETTIHDAQVGNARAQIPEKATLYDPINHIMRTTTKETTIHDAEVGNLKGASKTTLQMDDKAKTTTKETTAVYDTTRNISGHTYRVVVYDPDAVVKTTVKETTLGAKNELGYVAPINSEGAYTYIKVDVPNTQKQFISNNDYYGSSQSKTDFRPMSKEAALNAEIDGTREALNIASGYTPNAGGGYTSLEPKQVKLDTKKSNTDSMASRAVGNVSRIAQTPSSVTKCVLSRGTPQKTSETNQGRLDGSLLTALQNNPYNLSINPVCG